MQTGAFKTLTGPSNERLRAPSDLCRLRTACRPRGIRVTTCVNRAMHSHNPGQRQRVRVMRLRIHDRYLRWPLPLPEARGSGSG